MSNPVQAKALSAEELAEYHDNIGGWSLGVRRFLATIAERDKQIAAVEKLCDERHALAAEQFGDEIEAQYVMLDEAEIRSALTGKQ